MPELPEVETIVRSLRPLTEQAIVRRAHVLRAGALAAGEEFLPALCGARICAVRRRAKLVLFDLEPRSGEEQDAPVSDALHLVFHLKMTGRLLVRPEQAEAGVHTRLVFDLEQAGAKNRLFFDDTRAFGYCRIMRPEDFLLWDFWTRLGPEPLVVPFGEFERRLQSRKGLKALLLDQSCIAGIGNIYADETLFRAGLDPRRSAASLAKGETTRLFACLQEVLAEAIAACGSSIRDYRDAGGNAGAFQNSFRVYGRGNAPCLVCGAPLKKLSLAGRAAVYCPGCQK